MKRTIRLSERKLKRMISESVKRVMTEATEDYFNGNVDNEYILRCLLKASKNQIFVNLLDRGIIELRAEHYENGDIDRELDFKICSSIEEAVEFVKSSTEQTYIYVQGSSECMSIEEVL